MLPEYVRLIRKTVAEDALRREEDLLSEFYADYANLRQRQDDPGCVAALMLAETIAKKKTEIRRLQGLAGWLTNDQAVLQGGPVPDEEIERARQFPFPELVEAKEGKKILCPFHDDSTPSFHVYKDHGYCFTCQESADGIGWQMKVHHKSFKEAVRSLL